ncbi:hypothetical protein EL22_27980 [Halostagnicola sp. A56]|nr:hypothetical protein EL22_27980 [Halostagnicola sp. A56]
MSANDGKHLTGSDVESDGTELDSLEFDEETRELIGLDDIAEIIGEIDEEAEMDLEEMEKQAQAIKEGKDAGTISDPDDVIEEMDQSFEGGEGQTQTETESETKTETDS